MNRLLFLLFLGLSFSTVRAQSADDRAGVMLALNDYFEGGTASDTARLAKAFHPSARLQSVRDGQYAEIPLQTWLSNVAKNKPTTPPQRSLQVPILDIQGTAAFARLEISVNGKLVFTDYMTLLKVGGKWLIVNKSFHRH